MPKLKRGQAGPSDDGLVCTKHTIGGGIMFEREQWKKIYEQNLIMRDALEEIRDVANVSEGVQFYAMLAEKALDKCRDN